MTYTITREETDLVIDALDDAQRFYEMFEEDLEPDDDRLSDVIVRATNLMMRLKGQKVSIGDTDYFD